MHTRRTVLATLVAAACCPATASAAITIGSTGGTLGAPASGPFMAVQQASAAGSVYTSPVGGVITSWAIQSPGSPESLELKVLHPDGFGGYIVRASASATTTTAPGTVESFAVEPGLTIAAGDTLGLYVLSGSHVNMVSASADDLLGYTPSAPVDPGVGSTYTPAGTAALRLPISATIEPDADHDGYGDETQDGCPTNPSVHLGDRCPADLALSQVPASQAVVAGADAVITATVTNTDLTDPAVGASVDEILPAALRAVAASGPAGPCALGATPNCPLGTIPAGASRTVQVVVRATASGSFIATGAIRDSSDFNHLDDVARTTLKVTSTSTSTTTSAKLCRVPRLLKLTTAVAARRLKAAGCRLGHVRKARSRRRRGPLRISSQTVPAGIRVAAGTAIAVTVKR